MSHKLIQIYRGEKLCQVQQKAEENLVKGAEAIPAAIERCLKGIHYPASKDDLLKQAKGNGAPEYVLNILSRFEDKKYNTIINVSKEVGQVE